MTPAILITAALLAQAPPAAPRPVIDNERVRVWQNVQPLGGMVYDSVAITAGSPATATFVPKGRALPGAEDSLVIVGDSGRRAARQSRDLALLIELKDHDVTPLANTSGHPEAFPRPGIIKLLENDRVIVWDYTWTVNEPTPMHFHSRDVVVMFLDDGPLKSTLPDGRETVNNYTAGTVRFNARDRVHFETLLSGRQRAIITELKP
jgi:hypothetical protein